MADWKGKRIGANQGVAAQVKAVLEHSGLKFEDITFIQAASRVSSRIRSMS